ncbi:hypothetical protein PVMG_03506 [Plasmodium vivax Mauritania I]|uniref:Uncharacterized protein n=2 Tax=Plasmodium vivax TaxID=5855 RepID=A0A0J9T3H5_PLAVI|nr:hypothetical protein PVBG_00447 [Plasmodium vivax Brazil I]KMZ89945.1 hypothetical protein PVMG_03506 [Plasmodium vivax Mauritania I]
MSNANKQKGKSEADLVDKLNYKNLSDVMLHELTCLKANRQVYLKRGGTFFLSSREEALSVLKEKKSQTGDKNSKQICTRATPPGEKSPKGK